MKWYLLISFLIGSFTHVNSQNLATNASKYEFIANKGQFHPLAKYKANIPYGDLYLESNGLTYDLVNKNDYDSIMHWRHDFPAQSPNKNLKKHSIRLLFANTSFIPKTSQINFKNYYFNYYISDNQQSWATNVHPSSDVIYHNVYPDVDFEISGKNSIKYQWVIRNPAASKVNTIGLLIEGYDSLIIDNEQLVIKTSVGSLIEEKPFAYQIIKGKQIAIKCSYKLQGNYLSYHLQEDFNPDYDLIIDPKLIFSTYSGSVGDNFGFTATYDSRGNLYAGGIVNGQGPYPVTSGAYDQTWNGGVGRSPANLSCDISISKYDSSGNQLLWSTYLGGFDDEYPHSLVVDRNDDLFLLGTTYSDNFPTTKNSFDTSHAGGTDIIVSKLSSSGNSLIGSSFIGGDANDGLNLNSGLRHNYADDYRGDIIADDDGNVYIASVTQSDSMPLVDEIQASKKGSFDGYIFSLDSNCASLNWATYLGGKGHDAFYSIKLDSRNNVYVGGGTTSSDLPSTDTAYQKDKQGNADGVIAIFNEKNKQIKQLTYWGSTSYDQIYFIDIDPEDRIYATGQTEGNITKTPNAYGESNKGQFIFRIDTLLRNIDLQTSFGNANNFSHLVPSAFLVDVCSHIYFSGWGSSATSGGNTLDLEVTADAEQSETDNNDFYIIVLDKDASSLLYATYFGGDSTSDHVDGGTSRFDKRGVIYQSVCSSCPEQGRTGYNDFPVSSNAAFTENVSVRCSNASFKIDLQIKTAVIADFIPTPSIGCGPLDVQFTNKSILGDSLIWDFGDGDTSTEINPKHLYEEPGVYTVTLTVIDSNTCNISSVYERQIEVIENSLSSFTVDYDVCTGKLTLDNTSENAYSYRWDFDDNSASTEKNPEHQYENVGDYTIKLFINEGNLCESVDSQQISIVAPGENELKLYNIFTPNNDGVNDCFKMEGVSLSCSKFLLKIFNRWGEKVFETKDPEDCWNGQVFNDGPNLPSGTYFYILTLGDKSLTSEPFSGSVDLVR